MKFKTIIISIAAICLWQSAAGQFYDTGQAPASQKWNIIRTDSLKIVYPIGFDQGARRVLGYMEAARPYINHGFSRGPLKTPVVINTENFYSNGVAMLAPKHIEMIAVPSTTPYANPWLKQLSTHEYRHMVQYGNMNRSTVKVLSYIFGQQLSLVATGVLPFWFLEGDATMAETQFSEFGRGLQPSFTMHYRAAGREMLSKKNPDKWFCGSYKDHVPSHYEIGYQLVAHSERMYGKYIWEDVTRFGSDYPFLLFTTQLALHKYYRTSTRKLYRETFGYLNDHWDSLPESNDSAEVIAGPVKTYTTYEFPVFTGENTLLALKTDLRDARRFVSIDLRDNSETLLCHTGAVNSRPVYYQGMVFWTEYQSTIWEQRTNSIIRYMGLDELVPRTLGKEKTALYFTPLPYEKAAYVRYNYNGTYSVIFADFNGTRSLRSLRLDPTGEFTFPAGTSIHGLAYDGMNEMLGFIALSDDGMWLGCLTATGEGYEIVELTSPSLATLSDLSAGAGKFWFGSIYSGRDEAHCYDPTTGIQSRISSSRYGSFAPSPSPGGDIATLTVYQRDGYKIALQDTEAVETIPAARLPHNIVNPAIADWGIMKIDTVEITAADIAAAEKERPSKRYRKGLHLFNFHSWAPADYDIADIMALDFTNIGFGITGVSNNLLNTASTRLSYGYTTDGHSVVKGSFSYYGWAPKFSVSATWSDRGQMVYYKIVPNQPEPDKIGNYVSVNVFAYLPFVISKGYWTHYITPSAEYLFRNSLFYNLIEKKYSKNEHIVVGGVTFSGSVRLARQNLLPRWGYVVRARALAEPGSRVFRPTAAIYAKGYTPGLIRNHGITVEAAAQACPDASKGFSPYSILDLLPRGVNNFNPTKYFCGSVNYYLPLAYPDWGLSGVFFLKRIYMKLGADFSRFQAIDNMYIENNKLRDNLSMYTIYSYGGTVSFELTPLRLPSQAALTLSVGCYIPSTDKKPYIPFSVSVSF